MEKVIHCRDLGYECDGIIRAHTEEEALELAIMHAERLHGLQHISPEIREEIRAAVREKPVRRPVLF